MVLLGRRTVFHVKLGTSPAEMVYGQTLKVPVDLVRTQESGIADMEAKAVLAKLHARMDRPPAPTTGLHNKAINWPKTAEKATHVCVKKGHCLSLRPNQRRTFSYSHRYYYTPFGWNQKSRKTSIFYAYSRESNKVHLKDPNRTFSRRRTKN